MQRIRNSYRHTLAASYLALFVQAVVNNFVPLLLLTFQREYGISLEKIALLVGFNFAVQLLTDFAFAHLADRFGYRRSMVLGNLCAAAGLAGLGFLPEAFPDPFAGLMAAVAVYGFGAGIIEVLASPIVEHCPTKRKAASMSLLHSFYCWGHVFVVVASTVFFTAAGIGRWRLLALLWALFPLLDALYFLLVPISAPEPSGKREWGRLLRSPVFWLLFALMVCSGASEQAVSQWSSAFAEAGLKVSKAAGDLAGPMLFALMMGAARVLHARAGERIVLKRALALSGGLCVAGYFLIIFAPDPLLGFLGMGMAGFSVGIFWPGTLSLAAVALPAGGTAMYALLALAGDVGCSLGPSVVGFVSGRFGGSLSAGFLAALGFPLLLLAFLYLTARGAARRE